MMRKKVGLCLAVISAAVAIAALITPAPASAAILFHGWMVNANSRQCVGVPGGRPGVVGLVQGPCSPSVPSLTWHIEDSRNDGQYWISNAQTGGCVTDWGQGQANQASCSVNEPGQRWRMTGYNDGTWRIQNAATGRCLAVDGGSTQSGAAVISWPCGDWRDHRWILQIP
jgi:hypothetical protein